MTLNGSNSEESIYDVFNHKFLGEISDGTKWADGRWAIIHQVRGGEWSTQSLLQKGIHIDRLCLAVGGRLCGF